MEKNWSVKLEDMEELFHWDEAEGCMATDRIMVDGEKVGYMYRENPDFKGDSGWRFLAGDEDDEYMNNPKNSGIYILNSVANNDRDIIPFFHSPIGAGFYRDEQGNFVKDDVNIVAKQEIDKILYEYDIENAEDYKNKSPEELAEIYENIKIVAENHRLADEDVEEILESLFGEFEA